MDEEGERLIRDVFGSSSDSEEDNVGKKARSRGSPLNREVDSDSDYDYEHRGEEEAVSATSSAKNPRRWEHIAGIEGLWICREFLSTHQQSALLSSIENEGWFCDASISNQAMRFGNLPEWAVELATSIHLAIRLSSSSSSSSNNRNCIMASELLEREPFFNQMIANLYQPGEGICAHVDLLRFEDGIALVSLESPCVMHFTRAVAEEEEDGLKIPVLLSPGSLLVMSGDARYGWKHEINRKQPGVQVWEGCEIDQRKRTSITLRKLCSSPTEE